MAIKVRQFESYEPLKSSTYITDLVLRLLESLHLRRVHHHAETLALVLFKVLLVESLK